MASSSGFALRSLVVRVFGRNLQTGRVDFDAQLRPDQGINSLFAPRPYGADERVEINIEVDFHPEKVTRAAASVGGFQGITLSMEGNNSLRTDIQHAYSAQKDCELICFETGQTSSGPCLTCPDGEYEIRMCC